MSGSVVVFGSANADKIHLVDRIPGPGETVRSRGVSTQPGGKGLNQAAAATRAGAPATLIAAVGEDRNAEMIRTAAATAGVDISLIRTVSAPTGAAMIAVDGAGENTIIVQDGANGMLTELLDDDIAAIRAATVVLAQLEVPLDVVVQVARLTREAGNTFVLNPSPVRELPAELLGLVDVLVVNEHEAQQLAVHSLALPCVITTLGADGAEVRVRGEESVRIPPRRTVVVDATGAGDTFTGVLAAELASGSEPALAATRATVGASLSVERMGAMPSIPTGAEIDAAMSASVPSHN